MPCVENRAKTESETNIQLVRKCYDTVTLIREVLIAERDVLTVFRYRWRLTSASVSSG